MPAKNKGSWRQFDKRKGGGGGGGGGDGTIGTPRTLSLSLSLFNVYPHLHPVTFHSLFIA
jgi:hypothetical protein